MYLPEQTLDFLKGKKTSDELTVAFDFNEEDQAYTTQMDLLCKLAARKRVIHVGCVDYDITRLEQQVKRKKWLHSKICGCAQRCHGTDTQTEGIRFIREKLGYNDTSAVNIFSDDFFQLAQGDEWDSLFIPEMLEHQENPSSFLREISRRYGRYFNNIIITVPNGLSYENWLLAKNGNEVIHSEHHFWFTPYTIAKCIINAGLQVEKMLMCNHGTINWRAFRKNRFFRKHPLLRNDILCIAKFT